MPIKTIINEAIFLFFMIGFDYEGLLQKIMEHTSKSKEEVEQLIERKIQELNGLISKQGAAHLVAKELGVVVPNPTRTLRINNILPGMNNVEIVGKIIKKYPPKEYKTEKREGKVASLLLGDATGMIRAVFWDEMADIVNKFNEGDVIKISNAYSRKRNDRREIHITSRGKVEVVEDKEAFEYKRKNIIDLSPGEFAEIYATIVQVFEPRFFEICPQCFKRLKVEEGKFICNQHGEVEPIYRGVINLLLDDGTSTIRLVVWEPQVFSLLNIQKDEFLLIKNNPERFFTIRNDLLGKIVRVIGRVEKNDLFDRLELVASDIQLDPLPPTQLSTGIEQKEEKISEENISMDDISKNETN